MQFLHIYNSVCDWRCSYGRQRLYLTYLLQSHHCQSCTNGWVHLLLVLLTLGSHTRHLPRRPAVKPLEGFLQPGVRTHVSDPNRSTSCTTAIYNLPAVLLPSPSLPIIFYSLTYFSNAPRRFCSTASQSLLVDNDVRPRYQNKETTVRVIRCVTKTLTICSYVSSTTNLCQFLFVPRWHISEFGCVQWTSCGTCAFL